MNVNLQRARIVRASEDGNVKLVRRSVNQYVTYYVVVYGNVTHQGHYKHCAEQFNKTILVKNVVDYA